MDYEQFRADYEQMHPASVPQAPADMATEYPRWLPGVILGMFACAALISGVHTVPTVFDGIEKKIPELARVLAALGSFVAIELSFFVSPFARIHGDRRLSNIGLAVSFAIALSANLNSVLKAMSVQQMTFLTIVVAAFFGVGVPILAFTSGALFVSMKTTESSQRRSLSASYQADRKAFDAVVLTAFRKHSQAAQPAVHSLNSLNEPTERDYSANSSTGYTKRMDAKSVIHEWLTEHPEHMNDRLDDLLPAIESDSGVKVGRTSIHNVRKEMIEQAGRDGLMQAANEVGKIE